MATTIVEGFSLTHAQVLDGATSFEDAIAATADIDEDLYGVDDASLDPNTGDYDNEGDNVVLSTWSWLNFADIAVRAGYLSFPVIAALTGQTVSSSGAGAAQVLGLDLWHEDSFNVAPKPMIISMLSRDHAGVARHLTMGIYRAQFKPITFDGPRYKDGLKVHYNARATYSALNELGAAFADGKKRVGKVLSTA